MHGRLYNSVSFHLCHCEATWCSVLIDLLYFILKLRMTLKVGCSFTFGQGMLPKKMNSIILGHIWTSFSALKVGYNLDANEPRCEWAQHYNTLYGHDICSSQQYLCSPLVHTFLLDNRCHFSEHFPCYYTNSTISERCHPVAASFFVHV
jgi:hypothetical protein